MRWNVDIPFTFASLQTSEQSSDVRDCWSVQTISLYNTDFVLTMLMHCSSSDFIIKDVHHLRQNFIQLRWQSLTWHKNWSSSLCFQDNTRPRIKYTWGSHTLFVADEIAKVIGFSHAHFVLVTFQQLGNCAWTRVFYTNQELYLLNLYFVLIWTLHPVSVSVDYLISSSLHGSKTRGRVSTNRS